jgi:hypothetical protein
MYVVKSGWSPGKEIAKDTDKTPAEARQWIADSESKCCRKQAAILRTRISTLFAFVLTPIVPPKHSSDGRRKQYIHLGS